MKQPASLDPAVRLSRAASMLPTAVDTDVTGSPEEEVAVALEEDLTTKEDLRMKKGTKSLSHNSAPHPADDPTGPPAGTTELPCVAGDHPGAATMAIGKDR